MAVATPPVQNMDMNWSYPAVWDVNCLWMQNDMPRKNRILEIVVPVLG